MHLALDPILKNHARLKIWLLCTAALWIPSSTHAAQFTTFDPEGSRATIPLSINSSSTITGSYENQSNEDYAFLRTADGTITTLQIKCGAYPGASSMNDRGFITGQCTKVIDGESHVLGYLRKPDGRVKKFEAADDALGTYAFGINNKEAITGYYYVEPNDYTWHGFVRTKQDGIITSFDPRGSQYTTPVSINLDDVITGYFTDTSNVYHGFQRPTDGSIVQIDVPGAGVKAGQGTLAFSINTDGSIAGYYLDKSNVFHGFVRDPTGTITSFDAPDAGTSGHEGTAARAINGHGVIAGDYVDANGVSHGFLRLKGGSIEEFSPPHAVYSYIYDLNDDETVIGSYYDGSSLHGFQRTR